MVYVALAPQFTLPVPGVTEPLAPDVTVIANVFCTKVALIVCVAVTLVNV